ncbi:MAG TPA: hypothetical protein VEH06_17760, partial [Candidatus Bathyarchaeia archaeon]|nr:hypothetical protein [Candidatus Bathyarchaeia archaeon]
MKQDRRYNIFGTLKDITSDRVLAGMRLFIIFSKTQNVTTDSLGRFAIVGLIPAETMVPSYVQARFAGSSAYDSTNSQRISLPKLCNVMNITNITSFFINIDRPSYTTGDKIEIYGHLADADKPISNVPLTVQVNKIGLAHPEVIDKFLLVSTKTGNFNHNIGEGGKYEVV